MDFFSSYHWHKSAWWNLSDMDLHCDSITQSLRSHKGTWKPQQLVNKHVFRLLSNRLTIPITKLMSSLERYITHQTTNSISITDFTHTILYLFFGQSVRLGRSSFSIGVSNKFKIVLSKLLKDLLKITLLVHFWEFLWMVPNDFNFKNITNPPISCI